MAVAHRVEPTLKVGDKVSTMSRLTRIKMRGIIREIDGDWCMVEFTDEIVWINAEQLEKEE